MKDLRKILVTLCLLISVFASGQVAWIETDYDFGTWPETEGPRAGYARLVNLGSKPTIINYVKPTCGCTVAEFTDEEIAPGDTATITFSYNPAGRPGRFNKSIKVSTGTDNHIDIITIRGTVIGSDRTLATMYPVALGPLRMTKKRLHLGDVRYGAARNEFLHAYNQSADSITIGWDNVPPQISITTSGAKIAPGDIASIGIFFNTLEESAMGEHVYTFDLTAGNATTTVEVAADIVPDTSKLTPEQVADGPRIRVEPDIVDLGNVMGKQRMEFSFTVSNDGKSPLNISRIYSRERGIKVLRMPTQLKPGKHAKVECEISGNALADSDVFSHTINVITDDPLHPLTSLRVSGYSKQLK